MRRSQDTRKDVTTKGQPRSPKAEALTGAKARRESEQPLAMAETPMRLEQNMQRTGMCRCVYRLCVCVCVCYVNRFSSSSEEW